MNRVTRSESEVSVLGVKGRAFNVVTASDGRILNQVIKTFSREYTEGGQKYRISAELRFDDNCNNEHESFSITATGHEWDSKGAYWRDSFGGCCHEQIAKHLLALAPLIKWHLTSTDGPMHYEVNTVYHAGDRDHNGLRKGEVRQIRNGKTGALAWIMKGAQTQYHDGEMPPTGTVSLQWEPWNRIGEGKARELDFARSSAVWPDATDAELMQEPEALKAALRARLPALLADFQDAMRGAGFVWPVRQAVAA